jgi:hypothetical protein
VEIKDRPRKLRLLYNIGPISSFILEQHGLCRAISYIIQTLSAEVSFGLKLSSPVKIQLPTKWNSVGSVGDFIINVSGRPTLILYCCGISEGYLRDYSNYLREPQFLVSSIDYRPLELGALLQGSQRHSIQSTCPTLWLTLESTIFTLRRGPSTPFIFYVS